MLSPCSNQSNVAYMSSKTDFRSDSLSDYAWEYYYTPSIHPLQKYCRNWMVSSNWSRAGESSARYSANRLAFWQQQLKATWLKLSD